MKRRHIFEFLDLKSFPAILRDFMTDYLQFVTNLFDLFEACSEKLIPILREQAEPKIIDLCSGGGGPWKKLLPRLKANVPNLKVTLTDFFPNETGFQKIQKDCNQQLDYTLTSVNALNVEPSIKGMRTIFLGFHHFEPENAQAIIQNAIDANEAIAIFEAQERNLKNVLQFSLVPLFVLLFTPFIRPFKLSRLFFTYVIPLVPIFILFDGIVSVLRTYTPEELQDMATNCQGSDSYSWDIGVIQTNKNPVVYLIGKKRA